MTSQHSASAEANHEGTGIECVTIDGVEISVTRRDLIEESFDDCIDPCFFEQDYTVAASTGFHIWEGCHIMIDQLQSGALNEMASHPSLPQTSLLEQTELTLIHVWR